MYHKEPSYHFHLFHQVTEPSEYPWEVHPVEGWQQDWVLFLKLPDLPAPSFAAGNPSLRKPLSGQQYPSICNERALRFLRVGFSQPADPEVMGSTMLKMKVWP